MGVSTKGDFDVPVVHELFPNGTILQTLQFPAINTIDPGADRAVLAFDISPQGNYIFGFNTLAVVPEPGTFLLVCCPTATVIINVRHRRRRTAIAG